MAEQNIIPTVGDDATNLNPARSFFELILNDELTAT